MGEIRVHEDRRVALRPVGELDRSAKQRLDRRRVSPPLGVIQHGEGKHSSVRLEYVRRRVGRAVIQHEELILPGKAGENLPDLPEEKADGRGFVVARNANVNHDPSRK